MITKDEFEDVKQLLATTAQYVETANRKFDQLTDRLDTFVFESQRSHTDHTEPLAKLEGISERLEGILSYLVRQQGRGE
jgi:hypothetical protein